MTAGPAAAAVFALALAVLSAAPASPGYPAYEKANALFVQKKLPEALAAIEESLRLDPQLVPALTLKAKLAMAAYQHPMLRQFSTDSKAIVEANGRPMQFGTTNHLVASPDWAIGLQKTGFINEAGRCLLMQAVIEGRSVIMVFLDSKGKQSRTADAGRMRTWLQALKPAALTTNATSPVYSTGM